jgi:diguanylate cyclase (GGDEF)-like protein
MQNTVRASDSVARLGGDEFALLLPDTGPEGARVLLAKLQEALRTAMRTYGWDITFSVGLVTFHLQRRIA